MAVTEIKIKSAFDDAGVKQAESSLSKLKNTGNGVGSSFNLLKSNFSSLTNLSSVFSGGMSGVVGSLSSVIPVAGAVVGALALVGKSISACVSEFSEAEVVNVRFENSLKTLGLENYKSQFENLAKSIQKLSGTSDDAVKDAIQIGLQMGINADEMNRTIKVAANLAAVFGIDLKTAVEMLAKADEGQTTQLTRLIPALKSTVDAGASYSDILGVIEERTKGAAEASGNTLTGSMNKLKEAFGDLKENIGRIFAPVIKWAVDLITGLIDVLNNLFDLSKTTTTTGSDITVNNKGMSLDEAEKAIKAGYGEKVVLNGQAYAKEFALRLIEIMKKEGITFEQAKLVMQMMQVNKNLNEAEATAKVLANQSKQNATQTTETKKQNTNETKKQETTKTQSQQQPPPPQTYDAALDEFYLNTKKFYDYQQIAIEQEYNDEFNIYKEYINQTEAYKREEENKTQEKERAEREKTEQMQREKIQNFWNNLKNFAGNALGVNLSSVKEFFLSLLQQTKSFQAFSNVMKPIITMLDAVFKPILQTLAPVLQVLYKVISFVLKIVMPPIIVLAAIIQNVVLAFKAVVDYIKMFLAGDWSGIKNYKVNWVNPAELIEEMQTNLESASNENAFGQTATTTSTTNYSASGARDIYVNIYFQNSYVNGDAREIALRLRDEIRLAEAMGY